MAANFKIKKIVKHLVDLGLACPELAGIKCMTAEAFYLV